MTDIDTYRGWAPCVHSEEAKAVLPEIYHTMTPSYAAMECINIAGGAGEVKIWGDQWFAICLEGQVGYEENAPMFRSYIQCDRIEEGLVETVLVWRRKHQELFGKEFEW